MRLGPPVDLGQQSPILILGTVVQPGDNVSVDYRQLLKFLLWRIVSELGIENIKR